MNVVISQQYALVRDSRRVLLEYCATLSAEHFVAPVPAFNNGSMRDLLVHVVRTYHGWLGQVGLQQPPVDLQSAEVPDLAAVRALFDTVDALVADFTQRFAPSWLMQASFVVPSQAKPLQLTPLQLFTHVITHEFHHKGQLLSMSRLLGYTPVDADIIRTG